MKHKNAFRAFLFSMGSLRRVLTLAILYIICFEVGAQSSSDADYKIKVIPPSPDAAALGKFGDIPVGYYTGVPDITIPLQTLEGRQLSLPVSLSYHAGGFKVEERASWVGLGWTLSAGGVISRTVRGLKDEGSNGYISLTDSQYNEITSCALGTDLLIAVANGTIDAEPDVFFFNVGGVSGKLFFDHHGNVILESPKHYVLQYTVESSDITSWTLKSDDGTTYQFGGSSATEVTNHRVTQPQLGTPDYSNTSWYLNKIIAPNGIDEITFEYDSYVQNIDINQSESYYTTYNLVGPYCSYSGSNFLCPSYGPVLTKTTTTISGKRLRRILTANHEAVFTAAFQRLDLPGQLGLSEIAIRNRQGNDLKKFTFSYNHFINGTGRLKLLSVKETGYFNSPSGSDYPPYEFTYNETDNVPAHDSKAQDYWGFYNGQASNSTLVPAAVFHNTTDGSYTNLPGANRQPGTPALANLITQIKYPTGGTTSLEYELHDYSSVRNLPLNEPILQSTSAYVDAYTSGQSCNLMATSTLNTVQVQINVDQLVKINATIDQCTPAIGSQAPYIQLSNSSGTPIKTYYLAKDAATGVIEDYVYLTAGTYTFLAKTLLYGDRASATLGFYTQTGTTHTKTAGGARIKKITSSPGSGNPDIVKEYFYTDESTGLSTGVLTGNLMFTHDQTNWFKQLCGAANDPSNSIEIVYSVQYFVRTSNTQMPLSTTSGSHVGYSKVRVATSGNGKEVFTYTSPKDYPDTGDELYPFFAHTSYDWARGKLLTHKIFNQTGVLLQSDSNVYNLQHVGGASGYMVRRPNQYVAVVECKSYEQITALAQLVSSTLFKIENTGTVKEQTTHTYDAVKGALPVSTTTTNSKGQTLLTTTKYPIDAASITGLTTDATSALNQMVSQNMIAVPIEKVDQVDGQTKHMDRSNFKITSISNAEFPSVTSAVLKDSREIASTGVAYRTVETYSSYDNYGHPQEYKNEDGVVNVFLWQSKGKVSAHAENASISDVAYTGFETDDATGQWSYTLNLISDGKTGSKSHGLNGYNVTRTGLTSSKQYIVSFWAKNGVPSVTNVQSSNDAAQADNDGWRYFEKVITGTTTLTISGTGTMYIDELRLFPVGSKMTTYTYEPAIGLVSTTDANNVITYYSYDAHGRLSTIKDHKKNLVKSLKYNYKNATSPQ